MHVFLHEQIAQKLKQATLLATFLVIEVRTSSIWNCLSLHVNDFYNKGQHHAKKI